MQVHVFVKQWEINNPLEGTLASLVAILTTTYNSGRLNVIFLFDVKYK